MPDTPTENSGAKVGGEEDTIRVTNSYRVPNELLDFIPQESAELYKIVPLAKRENTLFVGAVNPGNLDIRDALNFITTGQGMEYQIQEITEKQLAEILKQYDQASTAMSEVLGQVKEEHNVVLGIDDGGEERADKDFIREEAPIIKLMSTILAQAVAKGASDIHIEPQDSKAFVRYRLDGVLWEELDFPSAVHDSLVARVKILSNLRLDERRRPQDGRFSSVIQKNRVDFRVATLPTANGEKVTLRVLDQQKGLRTLGELGLGESAYERILEVVRRPFGLILATGPTGAGKTTTLYALLNDIDRKTKNIVSLEDPVEYRLDGINQSNIFPEIGYTFATGLRSVLRGDPDQILVGEIRDRETAHLAIQAALTGHLVYSTLHTNTAVGAITRLINFGIEPFLLAPTLSMIIGQRMLRRLDGDGKEMPVGKTMAGTLKKRFSDLPEKYRSRIPAFDSFREAVPTEENPSGMRGRIGAFEVLGIDDGIKSIILEQFDENAVYAEARRNGFTTMAEDAVIKGLQGVIPFSEVVKVSNEDALAQIHGVQESEETRR